MRGLIMILPIFLELCAGVTCPPVLAFFGVAMVKARSQGNFKRANVDSIFVFDFPLFLFLFFFVFLLIFLLLVLFSS